jgi:hypothetical protein
MIYLKTSESGAILSASRTRSSISQLEVVDVFFEEYPQVCWHIENSEVKLKDDADELRAEFFASILEEPEAAEPTPIPLDYVRYLALVKVAGGLSATVATSIIDGTHGSAEVNFLQRLMSLHTGNFVLSDPIVQSGLETLIEEEVLTQAGKDAIEANWPVE